jgi:hypothetical protein
MSQNTDTSQSQRIKQLKDRTIFAGYVANKTLLLQGVGQFPEKIEGGTEALTPSHYAVLNLGAGAVYTTVAEYDAIIAQNTIIPTRVPVVITPTILVYNISRGASVAWGGNTFTRNTNLANFSYTATISSIPASQVPSAANLIGVTIGNTVTSIGNNAFNGVTSLISVIFTPTSIVSSIGYSTFESCTGLTSITIPNSVTSISNYAFKSCTSLTSITIPNSVTSIGDNAFESCTAFTSVTLPTNPLFISISDYTFFGCTGLTSITIPNSVTSIGDYAFYSCTLLTSITIPNSVTSIGGVTFGDSGLTTVYISSARATALGITSPTANPPGVSFFGKTVATVLPS